MNNCTFFAPVIDDNSKILILGSMPGIISLEKNQYYANKRNQFWKIISHLYDDKLPDNYELRINFLLKHGIGLWDVIKTCERKGSLDSDIKTPVINDFNNIFRKYPGIKKVFFNGGKAYEVFRKIFISERHCPELIRLPSTSPAHAVKFEEKLNDWKKIIES